MPPPGRAKVAQTLGRARVKSRGNGRVIFGGHFLQDASSKMS